MTIAISPPAGYSASPHRSSPLSAPPLQAGHVHSSGKIAIPRKASHHAHSPSSSLSQASPGHPHMSPHRASPSHSHSPSSSPLSRSHPLLGSYPLSLLHARMATHRSHCASQFAMRVRAIATGPASSSSGPRAPAPLVLPFRATYYDLVGEEEPCIGGPSHSPWVADVDLEAHYFAQYTSTAGESRERRDEPPAYPGYRVPAVGQLQILIKTATAAVHAFVLPYDLSSLEPGARLLAKERTYVSSLPSSKDKGEKDKDKDKEKGESLRYAVQLQFACVPDTSDTINEVSYYLARTLKVVFTSSPPESGTEQRTERADEVVPPSSPTPSERKRSSLRKSITSVSPLAPRDPSSGLPTPSPPSRRRTSIEASTEWAAVRAQWRMRAAKASAVARGFEPLESRPASPVPVTPSPRSLLSALAPEEERERRPPLDRTQSGGGEEKEAGRDQGKRDCLENGHPTRPATSRTPSVASARSRRRLSREERELSARLRASNLGD